MNELSHLNRVESLPIATQNKLHYQLHSPEMQISFPQKSSPEPRMAEFLYFTRGIHSTIEVGSFKNISSHEGSCTSSKTRSFGSAEKHHGANVAECRMISKAPFSSNQYPLLRTSLLPIDAKPDFNNPWPPARQKYSLKVYGRR